MYYTSVVYHEFQVVFLQRNLVENVYWYVILHSKWIYIKCFIIKEIRSNEGLQQIVVFVFMTETKINHHKKGIEVNMTQRFGKLGTFGA